MPERFVELAGREFKEFWRIAEQARRQPELMYEAGKWEPWCYLPVNAVAGIVAHIMRDRMTTSEVETHLWTHIRMLTTASAWRMTKGVYVFDPEVLKALINTTADEAPPDEMFLHLPEWCPYIVTPGLEAMPGLAVHGFFAYVDDRGHGQVRHQSPELNFELLIDPANSSDDSLFLTVGGNPQLLKEAFNGLEHEDDLRERVIELCRSREFIHYRSNLPLGNGSFLAATDKLMDSIQEVMEHQDELDIEPASEEDRQKVLNQLAKMHARLGSLLLYLVSDKADVSSAAGNAMQSVVSNERRGIRTFQARQVHQWEVGYRIGAQIRAFEESSRSHTSDGTGPSVRPHVRKAHWHSFWIGPRDQPEQRKKRVRWLPPIPVNVDGSESLVPTVHRVMAGPRH